jgi:hypothetical protein
MSDADLRASFLAATAEEDPSLATSLGSLDEPASRALSGVLGRLVGAGGYELDARARLAARRLLGPIRRHEAESLDLLNKVLDYLDLDLNGRLDDEEIDLAARTLEAFAALTAPVLQLSLPELRTLASTLRALDGNDDHRLDPGERARLTDGLADLRKLFDALKKTSPRFESEL